MGKVLERPAVERAAATRSFNRFEQKFLIPIKQIPALRTALGEYIVDDRNAESELGYRIYSVYWDSPELRFFWEKIDGEKVRRKLRFRAYGTSPDVFIEVKQRLDRTVQKRRLIWPVESVAQTFGPLGVGEVPDEAVTNSVLSEVLALCHRFLLRPTMAISYRRRAYFGVYEPELRLTFDTRVQFSSADLDIAQPFEVGRYLLDPRLAIMEAKYSHAVPLWLLRTLTRFALTPVRISKYCSAVDQCHFGGQHTF